MGATQCTPCAAQGVDQRALERAGKTGQLSLTPTKGGAKLKQVPDAVWTLVSLRTLDLSENLLTELPPHVAKLTRLKVLRLSGNLLQTLPEELSACTSLQTLQLDHNQFESVPTVVLKLGKLRTLSLARNALQAFPCEVALGCPKLELLNLAANQLHELPDEFGHLRMLRDLDVRDNDLQTLPDTWKGSALHHIRLQMNPLSALPRSLLVESDIAYIDLEGTPLYQDHRYLHIEGWDAFQTRHKRAVDKGLHGGT